MHARHSIAGAHQLFDVHELAPEAADETPFAGERMENQHMSRNIDTVNTYLDGFRKNDHEQILSCLTDDIEWTVFGVFHLVGKIAERVPG